MAAHEPLPVVPAQGRAAPVEPRNAGALDRPPLVDEVARGGVVHKGSLRPAIDGKYDGVLLSLVIAARAKERGVVGAFPPCSDQLAPRHRLRPLRERGQAGPPRA